jgi:hypothetical protein
MHDMPRCICIYSPEATLEELDVVKATPFEPKAMMTNSSGCWITAGYLSGTCCEFILLTSVWIHD